MVTRLRALASRSRAMLVVELGATAAIVHGISVVSTPAAWIVGGCLVVVAVERQPAP